MTNRRTSWRYGAVLAAGVLTLAAHTASAAPEPSLSWSDCGDGTRCAVLTVPVNWADPAGPVTGIDVVRVAAKDPSRKTGTVVANLGAGNSTAAIVGPRPPSIQSWLDQLTERLDVVVFDPRGLGREGTRIDCPRPQPSILGLVRQQDEAGWRTHSTENAAYDAGCRQAAGPAFAGLDSWQIAHDLDALRAALGEPKLRYFGNSYGTTYGQAYAELFGTRLERMYLDGVADHTRPRLIDWLSDYALTQEQQLLRFRDWCARTPSCALNGSDAAKAWDDLVATSDRPGDLFAGALVGMNPPRWPDLARAIAKARAGDASDFDTVLQYPPAGPTGSVQGATLCHDFMPTLPDYQGFLRIERRLKAIAPRFGWIEGRYELGRCAGIPGEPAYPPHPLSAPDAPPVLVTIGELDNNTSHLGAAHVAGQFPRASSVRHGDGHAAYLLGNTCLRALGNAYLIDGTLPPHGRFCPGELTP
ncbi:alpha/beta hydrolase [Amycolatopsis pittospori]|uniref:alpha/beta hydrolase n=1 Tax=Amycolatopsis pittospori TaxID=2749434 RepID=UPI0015F09EF9|nr:alpha/beta hydrolase [Amycolatopsis pittospori]